MPGFLTLVILARVHEVPKRETTAVAPRGNGVRRLPRPFWIVLGIWTVFSLGNSSDVFLILRAHDLGLSTTLVVLAYALYNVVYSALSWPLGALSDRVARTTVLAAGLAVFALVYLGFAVASSSWAVWPLFTVYGVYIAATEGVARAWVADFVPAGRGRDCLRALRRGRRCRLARRERGRRPALVLGQPRGDVPARRGQRDQCAVADPRVQADVHHRNRAVKR